MSVSLSIPTAPRCGVAAAPVKNLNIAGIVISPMKTGTWGDLCADSNSRPKYFCTINTV